MKYIFLFIAGMVIGFLFNIFSERYHDYTAKKRKHAETTTGEGTITEDPKQSDRNNPDN